LAGRSTPGPDELIELVAQRPDVDRLIEPQPFEPTRVGFIERIRLEEFFDRVSRSKRFSPRQKARFRTRLE